MRLSAELMFVAGGMLSLVFSTSIVLAASPTSIIPKITVVSQNTSNNTVLVSAVNSPEEGWLVIRANTDGQPGTELGYAKIKRGTSKSVRVRLTKPKSLTRDVFAMLHRDTGKKGIYEYPKADAPLVTNGKALMSSFVLKNIPAVKAAAAAKAVEKTPETTKTNASSSEKIPVAPTDPVPVPRVSDGEALGQSAPVAAPLKEFTITAKQWSFEPASITVKKGDRVRITIVSKDVEHGFAIWEYDIKKTIPAGKSVVVDFIADQAGTFTYFCSSFCGAGHGDMGGELTVTE